MNSINVSRLKTSLVTNMSNTIDQASIIEAWEKTHKPKRSRSRLSDHDRLIRSKIDVGYTQKAIVELLSALGCITTHQNLSRYLKRTADKGKTHISNTATIGTLSSESKKPISGFGEMKKNLQGS